MSPVLPASSFIAPSSGVVPGLPILTSWSNPLPKNYLKMENREIALQNEHYAFLEMHEKGTRGVFTKTEYSILKILTVITLQQFNWTASNHGKEAPLYGNYGTNGSAPTHVIQGNATGLYLCMDNNSVIYQSPNCSLQHCAFHNEHGLGHKERYYRQINASMPRWYIVLNKDGSVQCGNMTRKKDATFQRIEIDEESNFSESPPFVKNIRGCCQRRCNDTKNCKTMRRDFFKLKLKELKKYYTKCILKNTNKRDKNRNRNARNR